MGLFDLFRRGGVAPAPESATTSPNGVPTELELPDVFRRQVVLVLHEAIGACTRYSDPSRDHNARLWVELLRQLKHANGILQLPDEWPPDLCVLNWFLGASSKDALDFIELAFGHARRDFAGRSSGLPPELLRQWKSADTRTTMDVAIEQLNSCFRKHRLPYELRSDKLIPLESTHLHAEAIAPALLGLADPRFSTAEAEFARAFEHQRHGRFPEAITDATKALESTLKITLDIKKVPYAANASLKQLVDAVFGAKLLPDYLPETLTGLRTLLANAGSIRNRTSAHGQGATPRPVDNALCSLALSQTAALIRFMLDVCIKPTR